MSVLLAALGGLFVAAAVRELWAERGPAVGRLLRGRLARLLEAVPELRGSDRLAPAHRLDRRLRLAGLAGKVDARVIQLARLGCGLAALPLAGALAPLAPGRMGLLVAAGTPPLAALLPDLAIERVRRRRLRRIAVALPDSLELMAVGAGAGGGAAALLRAAAAGARPGPLRDELLRVTADIECGRPSEPALRELGRCAGGELAALAQLLDRSRRLGSPLASGLQEQAAALRERQARETEERAARAAPKIQLVVALLLVPSALLLVAAAILANAEALLGGL